jgi:hydroxyquinol 1,2-dioxygenase
MHHIDEDNITGAVIARHAAAGDARVRELMTSLVQHLHGFARDIKLSEAEWAEGLRFLNECGELRSDQRDEFQLLSDTLGLSTLVTALNQRRSPGCTESTPAGPLHAAGPPLGSQGGDDCHVRGRVRALDGTPIAGAQVQIGRADADGSCSVSYPGGSLSGADGRFQLKARLAGPCTIARDGPVGRLLRALGRHSWRPANLHFMVSAAGWRPLVTQVFRRGDPYLESDAAFGARRSLVADWVRHGPGRAPDGETSLAPFYTLDFDFVLDKA